MPTTVILIHGAFAESSSWNHVAERLLGEGHQVIAYANPLRTIAGDAASLTELVRSIGGPVVLAGHSYGGAVMTNVPADAGEIIGLVYVAAFALQAGETPAPRLHSPPGGRSPRRSIACRCRAEALTSTSHSKSSINSSAPICRPNRRSC